MKKIMILGSCGAGKSTFAKKLHNILDIKIIHLDQHYWQQNWTRTEGEEWRKKVIELTKRGEWIMDGNYRSTFDIRLPQTDTVVWLDFSPFICFYRILKRKLRNNRVDRLRGCKERVIFELLKWILWTFPRTNRKDIVERLRLLKKEKNIIILKSNEEVRSFLTRLDNQKQL